MGEPAFEGLACEVLIIAGGSGTRFWPKSRHGKPKQLLNIWDEKTLLEHTAERFLPWGQARLNVVTTSALVQPSREVLANVEKSHQLHFLAEPEGRNTAPCILLGLLDAYSRDPKSTVCVVPADHYIRDEGAFRTSLAHAVEKARRFDGIITLGIRPDRPETGYGYIEMGAPEAGGFCAVSQFVEKPELRVALNYLKSGRYLWNAGIFVLRADMGLKAFEVCMPRLYALFSDTSLSVEQKYARIDKQDAISIDFGVMEDVQKKGIPISVLPVDYGWSDLGSFTALEEIDKAVYGTVVSHNSASNIVQCDSGMVALMGVNDLVVVKDGNVVLVTTKDRCQELKTLVERVRREHPQYS